jgi:hypothetical protein
MTKPGNSNQIQLSPEGAELVQAIAKKAGLPQGTVAAGARVVSRHELERDGVSLTSMEHPAGPTFSLNGGLLRPVLGASHHDLRLGISVAYQNGVASRWTIVMRRDGVRLCELDYDDEEACEREKDLIRAALDYAKCSDNSFSISTRSSGIRNFNAANGQEL